MTPWKNELACKLIELEDAEKLQKLTDLSTVVHGEINSLYDLVFSFQQEGLVKPLEGLKDATRDLDIDRGDIYYQLLLSYTKQGDAEKALGLWTQMQEEDLAPTDQFLLSLGSFLQERGLAVPFVIPQPKIQKRVTFMTEAQDPPKSGSAKTANRAFRQKLAAGAIDDCVTFVNQNKVSVVDASYLIETLIHQNRLDDAFRLTINLLDRGIFPVQKIFSNNTEKVEQIWQGYLKDAPRLMFQKIIQTARELHDEDLINRLIQLLKVTKVTDGALGNAYSCYIDVLVSKGKHDDAVQLFEMAVSQVPIENINRTAIIRPDSQVEQSRINLDIFQMSLLAVFTSTKANLSLVLLLTIWNASASLMPNSFSSFSVSLASMSCGKPLITT
ncbi:hypothetical protein YQE_08967, partial [Dendroctonus ponderosae]